LQDDWRLGTWRLKVPLQKFLLAVLVALASTAQAGEYLIDTGAAHASVNFKFDHLGVGRITGGFRKLGELTDEWGRHRVGFEAAVTLNTLDFDMSFPPSNRVLMELYIEGVKKS
jgi:polyisoprenoid-binding protein YceI